MDAMEIIPVKGLPSVKPGDDIGRLLLEATKEQGIELKGGDVIVVAQSVVSKTEGNIVNLNEIEPSKRARTFAERMGKDPRKIEVALRQTEEIVRSAHVLISRTKHGFVCANAGVDGSNSGPDRVTLLPEDPDASAQRIRDEIRRDSGKEVAVIISDSQGRPFRLGSVGIAIGNAGIVPLLDLRGRRDIYGEKLTSTKIATADALAASATLAMGESDEKTPAAVIKGAPYLQGEGSIKDLLRPPEEDLFR